MDFPLVSDAAAKQSIDASRAYKEMVRVQRQLQALGGTMFWKAVGGYTYLAQRTGGKLAHLGPRTPETEARFETFRTERSRLQARAKTLATRIQLHERMNHAVQAGVGPAAVVQALALLEALGIGQDCLWISHEALLAYLQSSGLAIPFPIAGNEPPSFYVLLLQHMPDARTRIAMKKSKAFEFAELAVKDFTVLLLRPLGVERTLGDFSGKEGIFNHFIEDDFLKDIALVIRDTPIFEQVVIGTKGRMGLMRAPDPRIFIALNQSPLARLLGMNKAQAELVEYLLENHRIASKMDDPDAGAAHEFRIFSPA